MRNGATAPARQHLGHVRRAASRRCPRGPTRARYSPICTTASAAVGGEHHAAHHVARARSASPTRRGGSRSGNAPSLRMRRRRAARSRARGGRGARRPLRTARLAAALHARGRAWCRPAGRPGRCAGCRTRAPGTCGPPPGSRARWTAGPCAGCRLQRLGLGAPRPPRREMYFSSDHALEHVVAALRARAPGCSRGERRDGFWGSPAISAASARVRSLIGLAEEELAGRLHPVVAVAEVDLVAVEGEDLFLGEVLLDLEGEDGLLDLALVGLLRGQEEHARELHGQGGEALAAAARRGSWRGRRPGCARGSCPRCFQKSASSTATTALRSTGGMSLNADHHAPLDGELAEQACRRRRRPG